MTAVIDKSLFPVPLLRCLSAVHSLVGFTFVFSLSVLLILYPFSLLHIHKISLAVFPIFAVYLFLSFSLV